MTEVAHYRGTGKRKTSVARVILKPGNGTAVCLEGEGKSWYITYAWRDDHAPG